LNSLPLPVLLGIYVLCAVAIWLAGTQVAKATDKISERYSLGEALGGVVILAIVTDLPEIAIAISAAATGQYEIILGNLLGGIAIQTLVVAVLDVLDNREGEPLTRKVGSLVVALEGLVTIIVVTVSILGIELPRAMNVFGLSPADFFIVITWLAGIAMINRARKDLTWKLDDDAGQVRAREKKAGRDRQAQTSMTHTWVVFIAAALVTLAAGVFLELSGNAAADQVGLNNVVFGATFLAAVTALPELSTGFEAVKLGEYQMAMSDVIGSNAFLMVLFFPASLIAGQPILAQGNRADLYLSALGVLLTAIYVGGVIIRPRKQILRMGADSLMVIFTYILGIIGLIFLPAN
jgi:cation:H+ antiporter